MDDPIVDQIYEAGESRRLVTNVDGCLIEYALYRPGKLPWLGEGWCLIRHVACTHQTWQRFAKKARLVGQGPG